LLSVVEELNLLGDPGGLVGLLPPGDTISDVDTVPDVPSTLTKPSGKKYKVMTKARYVHQELPEIADT